MKRILLVAFLSALLFAGCNTQPQYEPLKEGGNLIENSEAFIKATEKRFQKFDAEDWMVSVENFTKMCQDYNAHKHILSKVEQSRFEEQKMAYFGMVREIKDGDVSLQVKKAIANAGLL